MKQAIFTVLIAVLVLLTSCSPAPTESTAWEDEEPPAMTELASPDEPSHLDELDDLESLENLDAATSEETLEEYFDQWLLGDQAAFFWEGEWSYQIMRNEASVLSVLFTGLESGNAYPINLVAAYTFLWDENQQVVTKNTLDDLLVEDSREALMALLVETDDFAYYADYITAEQVEEHLEESIFYLTNTHIVIQFGEDILGPHALGTPAFSIPISDILHLLPVQ